MDSALRFKRQASWHAVVVLAIAAWVTGCVGNQGPAVPNSNLTAAPQELDLSDCGASAVGIVTLRLDVADSAEEPVTVDFSIERTGDLALTVGSTTVLCPVPRPSRHFPVC